MNVFNNFSLRSSISRYNKHNDTFGGLSSFFMSKTKRRAKYYIADYDGGRIYLFDDSFNFLSTKLFKNAAYIVTYADKLYITSDTQIWKTDCNLNILSQYTSPNGTSMFNGVYFNSATKLLYIAGYNAYQVLVFDLNFKQKDKIPTSSYYPFSITGYDKKLYVGTTNGLVLEIADRKIIGSFNGCNGNTNAWLTSIMFDQFGYITTTCDKTYLYHSNGIYTVKKKKRLKAFQK